MLGVLLTILKVIGIVLAVLLGLIIVLLLLLLFVPVRYDILAKYYDNKPYAQVNVTALFKLVRFKLEFVEKVTYWVKVLFFKVYDSESAADSSKEDKKPKKDKSKKTKKSKKSKKEETVFDEDEAEEGFLEAKEDTDVPKEKPKVEKPEEPLSLEQKEEEEPKGLFERICDKISDIFAKIGTFITGVKDKLSSVWQSIIQKKEDATEKVNDMIRIINDEGNREFARFVWEQLKYLLKKIKPTKGRLYVHFGMDDPETTGKIAMYLAVLYGLMGIEINIHPDFDEKVMEGELYLKGKLQLITILIIAVRLYMNKHFKRIVLKKEL